MSTKLSETQKSPGKTGIKISPFFFTPGVEECLFIFAQRKFLSSHHWDCGSETHMAWASFLDAPIVSSHPKSLVIHAPRLEGSCPQGGQDQ